MPAEKGRNAALTQEPDPDNAGVGSIDFFDLSFYVAGLFVLLPYCRGAPRV